jgi:uncharacterized protein Veg
VLEKFLFLWRVDLNRVKVKANMGRTRVIERMGTIKSVHPAVFIVEVDS